ncbi:MAG TPA: amino acid adenylation domain-containing protein, partial [Thermoanaerobaculia bacterium]
MSTARGDELELRFSYDADQMSAEDVEGFAEAFATLLRSAIVSPDRPISRLEILSDAERSRVLRAGTGPERAFPTATVLALFEEQARRTPDAEALVTERGGISYAEAAERSGRVASRLGRLGVGAESVVGILMDRSAATVLTILGVWKAGGAYLPIEVSTPPERRRFMLEDARAAALVTDAASRASFPDCPCPVLEIAEAEASAPEGAPGALPGPRPESLAYVIYTSGSTGQPKGVAVEHRQLANYVLGILERLEPAAGSSFASVSTFAADLGHTVLFPPLVSGGSLRVVDPDRTTDPDALGEDFAARPIDYLKIVPSHVSALLSGTDPERVLPRRCLVLGGEALSWELAARIHELAPACRLLNHYGPTETTVGATTFEPDRSASSSARTVPIGRPLPNVRTYVLDPAGRPVPFWAPGELYIAGSGVARGYANRPELTAERFLPDPFRPGGRMYRTGDLARVLPDGSVEWLGRIDQQVKIHGFRVELGEIETRLREHAAVSDAAVLLREDEPGVKRLVAYCVDGGAGRVSDDE